MNVAKAFDVTDYGKKAGTTKGAEVIYLTGKRKAEDKKVIITLMNKFLEITRREWLIMKEARNADLADPAYENRWDNFSERPSGADIIPLVSK